VELSWVYITAPSEAEALRIAQALVAERLAACATLVPSIRSFYWWRGALEEGTEVVVVAKTRAALVPELVARVKSNHSYQCPDVVALPINGGNPDYLAWVAAETREPR